MFQNWMPRDSSYGGAVGWCPTSDDLLQQSEEKLNQHIKTMEPGVFVDIGPVVSSSGDTVLTYRAKSRAANTTDSNTPLVLLHGFGCASAVWCLNVDELTKDRTVYFMDLLGFGRSSRPSFSKDPLEAEQQLVASIEAWRRVIGLDRFLLLGHSFGAYLATAYAIKHPHRVVHLILEDPWGFPQQTGKYNNNSPGVMLMWVLSHVVPPLFLLRWLGPYGRWYVDKLKPFQVEHFSRAVDDPQEAVNDYFYHCNARNPTGEVAFHSLMRGVAWARYPMINRVHLLRPDLPMTLIHGEKSWVSKKTSYRIKEIRPDSYVDVKVMRDAGHVVHSDTPDEFNSIVSELMKAVDRGDLPSTGDWTATPAAAAAAAAAAAKTTSPEATTIAVPETTDVKGAAPLNALAPVAGAEMRTADSAAISTSTYESLLCEDNSSASPILHETTRKRISSANLNSTTEAFAEVSSMGSSYL